MFGLRITACLALVAAGCGSPELDVASTTSAINSCNVVADCPALGAAPGACVKQVCNANHECDATTDFTACAGCTSDLDCSLGVGACYTPRCNMGTHTCDFSVTGVNTCACKMASDCANTATSCQNAATCVLGVCTLTAKAMAPCCNDDTDCNAPGTCNTNTNRCRCGSSKTYCPAGPSGCVTGTECCQDADCGTGNSCGDGTCVCGGTEKHCAGIGCIAGTGCCDNSDCTTPATCNGSNVCVCAGPTTKYCPGTGCILPTACCNAAECAPRANATVACTANACVYTCNSTFHDCSGVCKSDASVDTCGAMCSACPTGNACQTPTCTAGACGFGAAGASPCCNGTGDCAPANACQRATACTNNMCVFGSTGAAGCCNSAGDCAAPSDPCLQAMCVANQCATAPITGCVDDLALPVAPDDLSTPVAPPDLATPLSLSGGGGCAFGGTPSSSSSPLRAPLVGLALVLVAFALRRRRRA